jgi:hypothetical protein
MPIVWMRIPNGTPPQLEPYLDDPVGLERFVRDVVDGEGAELIALYFEVGRPVAYAVVAELDDFIAIKAVCRVLGAEAVTKLLRVDQAVEAVERDRSIRARLSGEPGEGATSATS